MADVTLRPFFFFTARVSCIRACSHLVVCFFSANARLTLYSYVAERFGKSHRPLSAFFFSRTERKKKLKKVQLSGKKHVFLTTDQSQADVGV